MTETDPTTATGPAESAVVTLDDPRATDPRLVGGKAATLAALRQSGLPVPGGFVVTTDAVAALLRTTGDGAGPDAESVWVAEVPDPLARSLAEASATVGERAVAVRSSAVAEDLPDASYAGQYETVLGARGVDEVTDALRRCCASALSERVVAYQAGAGEAGPIAVLVQPLIDAEAAGVAFTANPVTGARDETLVHAVRGLGDRLVAGEASPDEWVVRSDGSRATCVACPEGAIDAATAAEVAALARRVADRAGAPQDVEWALADGRVHLLQARPITALPTPHDDVDPPPGTWIKDASHYPGPISPLAVTVYLPRLERGIARMLAEFGFLMEGVRQRVIGGEIYVQPVPPTSDEIVGARIAAALDALGGRRPEQLVERWWQGGWRQEFIDRIDALRRRQLGELEDAELDAHLQACLDLLEDGQIAHFQLFVPYLLGAFDLCTTCEELLAWEVASALDLVTGLSDASAEPSVDLARLAADLRARPAAGRTVASWTPGQPCDDLLADLREIDPALADRVAGHLHRFGCRVPGYDVGDPTFSERPELTLRLLRDLVTGEEDPLATRAALARRREEAAERARGVLVERGAPAEDRARFEDVLDRARQVWGLREDNLLYTDTMPNGLIRLAALEIGRRLVAHGRLRRAEDAVWLELDELRAALRDPEARDLDDLRRRVARRRAEQAWVRANPGPPLHGDPPPAPPPMDGLPPEVQRINGALGWMMGEEFGPPAGPGGGDELCGRPGAPGRVTAPARLVRDEAEFDRLGPGEVLVCRLTTPAWTVLFPRAAAVVTDTGSSLSHAAIVAREHGIPAVVGTQTATSTIGDGEVVTVDGAAGIVQRTRPERVET